jgi:hypothetical protein
VNSRAFHLAFAVHDLEQTRHFYGEVLGCREGRCSESWVDFDFFGHQVTAHLCPGGEDPAHHNDVDGDAVPVPHFGAVLEVDAWKKLAHRVDTRGISFLIEPHARFVGLPGEQWTFFVLDPSRNALEFKAFEDPSRLFSTD